MTQETDPGILDTIPIMGLENPQVWRQEELCAVLEHQWNTSLTTDLDGLTPDQVRHLTELSGVEGTYGDVFSHPAPPLEVLEMIKNYAKRNMANPNKDLPEDIAKLLYILSVAVAQLRCGKPLTTQSDESVKKNIESALAQSWLTPPVVQILQESLRIFQGKA